MLINVLTRLAGDIGYHVEEQRLTLLQIVNQSAAIMHGMLECNAIYREITLAVPVNKVVSLPYFVGELKGMRLHTEDVPFMLNGVSAPRYIKDVLDYKFKNWRDLGISAIHTSLNSVNRLTFETNFIENVNVFITGQTDKADRLEETVLINSSPVLTSNMFGPRIDSIACVTQDRRSNIIIKDSDGVEIATLYNNTDKTRYKIVDVSEFCFPADTSLNESLIDVCYKLPLTRLVRDSDSFFAGDDYDEAWYNISMFCYLHPIQDRAPDAMRHQAAGLSFLNVGKSSENNIVRKLEFGRNKFYSALNCLRNRPGAITHIDNTNEQ